MRTIAWSDEADRALVDALRALVRAQSDAGSNPDMFVSAELKNILDPVQGDSQRTGTALMMLCEAMLASLHAATQDFAEMPDQEVLFHRLIEIALNWALSHGAVGETHRRRCDRDDTRSTAGNT